MDPRSLFGAVAERTVLTREESADMTRAVLEGLAGQLSDGEAERFAHALPEALAEPLRAPRRRRRGAHPIPVRDFVNEVSTHAGLTEEEARAGAAAVLAVLHEELGEGEYEHLIGQLPADYAALAEAGS